jgi:hypothetical protein
MTGAEVARARRTSVNAALRALKRMLDAPDPQIRKVGRYHMLVSADAAGAQRSLPVSAERDADETEEEANR